MQKILILGAALLFAACSSTKGPGVGCDDCAVAEANPVGAGSNAAAAAASGGQRANQAPFSGEAGARIDPQTTVGRGTGDTSASSADREHRETASGGAQNVAVNVPTSARAAAGGGGTSASVVSAKGVVTMYMAALQLAMARGDSPEQLKFLSEQLAAAQTVLATVEAGTRANIVNHYHQDHQNNTLFGVSSSSTDGRPSSASTEAAAAAVTKISEANAPFEKPAPMAAEGSSDVPPAGAPDDPLAPGDGE
ncbi:MAG: hypothetical protein GY720_15935 [bacterium]|nr:hypothetical protein [bacterium]MCP5117476.1 hypothetical protein [bacterium]